MYILLFTHKSLFLTCFYDFETKMHNWNLLSWKNIEFDILENGELVTLLWPLKADMKWTSESSSDLNTWPDSKQNKCNIYYYSILLTQQYDKINFQLLNSAEGTNTTLIHM